MKTSFVLFLICTFHLIAEDWVILHHNPNAPIHDNPLKGFVPYSGEHDFPHSMQWFYIGLDEIMSGPNKFTFEKSLETKLDEIAKRGCQSIFRVYLDYPSQRHAVPQFLIDAGHQLIPYKNDDADNQGGVSPDYNDPNLVEAMVDSIHAMGERYDGDPRLAFITVGYLGHWGEWHTYPNNHLMAKREVQTQIIRAFHRAFKTTKFLLRYPDLALENVPCGFHDDSFIKSTLFHDQKSWNFLSRMQKAKLNDQWKTEVIGGEIYPPFQKPFLQFQKNKDMEDYWTCVQQSHCTWLLNQKAFSKRLKPEEKEFALKASKQLGYDLFIDAYQIKDGTLKVKMKNLGVAPFYYKWPVQILNLETQQVTKTDWDITKVLPGKSVVFKSSVMGKELALSIENPLKNGKKLRFSNTKLKNDWVHLK